MAKEYDISKTSGSCCRCGSEIAPGEALVATLCETDVDFVRVDYCPACWESAAENAADSILGVWRTRVPTPRQKRKLFVDDEVLVSFFERLADATEPAKVNFRFVLALVLMRKKLLVYDRMTKLPDGREEWQMHFKGSDEVHRVIDPHMDEEQVAEVSRQIGEILEAEI